MPTAQRIGARKSLHTALWLLLIGLLASVLVHVFLSHWSLLDGAPRNGLGVYLEGQADRPFAYRWLAPLLVQQLSAMLPESLAAWAANEIAPLLQQAYVAPLLQKYEPLLPGITARALADWRSPDYRASYVLMAGLLWLSCAASLGLISRMARMLGSTQTQAALLALIYTLVYPGVFLHAGYFYDIFEQMFALLAICCVLRQRWKMLALVLVAMQCNRETAILLPIFLAPLIHATLRTRDHKILALTWLVLAMAACMAIDQGTKRFFAGNAGASFEFHLFQNLDFWRDAATWTASYDIYAIGVALPRLLFLAGLVPLSIASLMAPRNPMAWSAGLCLATMSLLFITVGYRDEFRAMGICLPLLLVALACRWGKPVPG